MSILPLISARRVAAMLGCQLPRRSTPCPCACQDQSLQPFQPLQRQRRSMAAIPGCCQTASPCHRVPCTLRRSSATSTRETITCAGSVITTITGTMRIISHRILRIADKSDANVDPALAAAPVDLKLIDTNRVTARECFQPLHAGDKFRTLEPHAHLGVTDRLYARQRAGQAAGAGGLIGQAEQRTFARIRCGSAVPAQAFGHWRDVLEPAQQRLLAGN